MVMETPVGSPVSKKKKYQPHCVCPFDLILCAQVTSQHKDRELLKNRLRKQLTCCNIDEITTSGLTALNQCVLDGNLESVKIFLELGASVNKKDRYGWAPLHYAASEGYLDICRYLLRKGAEVRVTNKEGKYPVELADDEVVFRLLLRATLLYNMPPLERESLMKSI